MKEVAQMGTDLSEITTYILSLLPIIVILMVFNGDSVKVSPALLEPLVEP